MERVRGLIDGAAGRLGAPRPKARCSDRSSRAMVLKLSRTGKSRRGDFTT